MVRWKREATSFAVSDVIPNVAESVEANEDGSEYTFHLREGMKWSDGELFTADDIMFWYEDVFMNEALTPFQVAWLTSVGEPVVVEKVDDYTVTFRFAAPNGLFLLRLASAGGEYITCYPRHYIKQFHTDYNENIDQLVQEAGVADWIELFQARATCAPGSPTVSLWQDSNYPTLNAWRLARALGEGTTQVVAERNPYYFKIDPEGNQLPYIDRVVYAIIDDAEVMVLRALGGEISMQDRHIATSANRAILFDNQERGNYGFFTTVPTIMNTLIIALNLTHEDPVKREIFNNKDFRIGLSHAIDRQEIIDLVYVGQGEPYQAAPRPESAFYNEELAKQYTEYDVALANETLDRAGYSERDAQGFRLGPDGQRIVIMVEASSDRTDATDILELVSRYWQEVGIDMQLRPMDRSLFYTRKDNNLPDATVWDGDGGLEVVLEPRWYFPFTTESNFAIPWANWFNNPEAENAMEPSPEAKRQMALYRQIEATADPEEQNNLMNQILEIAQDQFWVMGISLRPEGYGVVKNDFHNVPASMISAGGVYPQPAPTDPSQYFINGSTQ